MKKYIVSALNALLVSPLVLVGVPSSYAAEVICPAQWQASYGCNQCFQFYVTDADLAFSSSDVFYPRGNLQAGEVENLWLDESSITGFAMQGANIGPVGNLKSHFEFPHDEGAHANGKRHTAYGPGESNTWARMPSGTGIGIVKIPDNIDPEVPIYRLEYVTTSEVELANGQMKADSRRTHKECAMYSYAGLQAANAAIEITKDDNDNHDDYQKAKGNGGVASGEAGFGKGTAEFWIQVRNTGGATLENVRVTDPRAPDCDKNIGRLQPGETVDYVCRDRLVTAKYTNVARVEGQTARGDKVSDEDESHVDITVAGACDVTVNPPTGNAPHTGNITCKCPGHTNVRIIIGQLGNTLKTYDGLSATHTFTQVGNYDVLCVPNGDNSLSGKTTVFVTKTCGNGVVEQGETCDDGNMASGDGCSVACQAETCGNGMIDAGEQCDDGNNNNGDGCTNICQNSTPPTGPEDILYALFFISMLSASGWMVYRRKQLA